MVKGPAADAADAPKPRGLLCNPLMKMISVFFSFCLVMEHRWNYIDRGNNRSTREKPCASATLYTTNSAWTNPGSNPSLRCGRLATNRLSHGTALQSCLTFRCYTISNNTGRYLPKLIGQNVTCIWQLQFSNFGRNTSNLFSKFS
jgi:hypothetical protein